GGNDQLRGFDDYFYDAVGSRIVFRGGDGVDTITSNLFSDFEMYGESGNDQFNVNVGVEPEVGFVPRVLDGGAGVDTWNLNVESTQFGVRDVFTMDATVENMLANAPVDPISIIGNASGNVI